MEEHEHTGRNRVEGSVEGTWTVVGESQKASAGINIDEIGWGQGTEDESGGMREGSEGVILRLVCCSWRGKRASVGEKSRSGFVSPPGQRHGSARHSTIAKSRFQRKHDVLRVSIN